MDVNVKNKHGCTALHVASHAGKGAMVKLLIRLGASVNGPKGEMKGGYSALHVAAANGSSSSLSALLEGGANIRHSASESTIHRSASGTALELAEANDHKGSGSVVEKRLAARVREKWFIRPRVTSNERRSGPRIRAQK
jgi:ankyrin repeat protein